jgi:hypothetical protein
MSRLIPSLRPLATSSTRLAPQSIRTLTSTAPRLSLQNLFDTPDLPHLSVSKLTPKGFHLSDGLVVPGGLIFAGGRALLWDVDPPSEGAGGGIEGYWKGWREERFRVFETVVPRPGEPFRPLLFTMQILSSRCTACRGCGMLYVSWADGARDPSPRDRGEGRASTESHPGVHLEPGYTARCHGFGEPVSHGAINQD